MWRHCAPRVATITGRRSPIWRPAIWLAGAWARFADAVCLGDGQEKPCAGRETLATIKANPYSDLADLTGSKDS